MSDTKNITGRMRAAFVTTPPGDDRWQAVLDVLHANGYRRCAEGQRTTQWCDRANKAEAEVERLQLAYDDQHSVASLMQQQAEKAETEVDALRASCDDYASHKQRQDERILELRAEVERLRKGIAAVSALIADSSGVYGLHLNGDPAPWDELLSGGRFEEWLADFDAARGES